VLVIFISCDGRVIFDERDRDGTWCTSKCFAAS